MEFTQCPGEDFAAASEADVHSAADHALSAGAALARGRHHARQDSRGVPDRQEEPWSPTRSTTPAEGASTWVQPTTPDAGPSSMRGVADCPAAGSWWWSPDRCPGTRPSSWRQGRSRVTGAGPGSCRGTIGRLTASTIIEAGVSEVAADGCWTGACKAGQRQPRFTRPHASAAGSLFCGALTRDSHAPWKPTIRASGARSDGISVHGSSIRTATAPEALRARGRSLITQGLPGDA